MRVPRSRTLLTAPALGEPLQATTVGTLHLSRHPQPQRPPHLSAGSGLQVLGDHTYVIADDELHVARFPTSLDAPGTMLRVLDQPELPLDRRERKEAKPDLEALVRLPGSDGGKSPLLLGVPSGSKARRHVGFRWALDADGALSGSSAVVDLAPLYDALRGRVRGKLNVEGAAVRGAQLVLFHRGNAAGGAAAAISLDLATIDQQVRDGRVDSSSIGDVQEYDLGLLDGVRLGFTDAVQLPGGRIAFTAAAEVTDDPVEDGTVRGSAVGVLALDGRVEQLQRVGGDGLKVEGVALLQLPSGRPVPTPHGALQLRLVTDADDEFLPSQLLAVELPPQ